MDTEKFLDQIFRYTYDCRFSDEDWQKVLDQCRQWFGGGKVHRLSDTRVHSTYDKFIEWAEFGFKYGDYVSYGNTCGIVGLNVPTENHISENDIEAHSGVFMSAYLDFEGNLITHEMEVRHPERLKPLDEERILAFKKKLYDAGLMYYIRSNSINKLYIPQKYYYITLERGFKQSPGVGMYLESDGYKHHFAAYLVGNKLKMDCWVNSQYTPFKAASANEIRQLHAATSKAGWSFNEREKRFVKIPLRKGDNMYYYMNEMFDIVMDRDNGAKRHTDRYNVGNYFADGTEALAFAKQIKEMRGKS